MRTVFSMLLLVPLIAFGGIFELFDQNLERSSSYLSALDALKTAEVRLKRYTSFWNPTVTVSAKTITISEDGVTPFTFSLDASFLKFYGFSVSLSFPFKVDGDWNVSFEGASLNISRGLKDEYGVERLQAESELLSRKYGLKTAKNTVFINTISDIFNWGYYSQRRKILEEKLNVLKRQRDAAVDEDKRKNLEREISSVELELKDIELKLSSLEGMDERLYAEAREILSKIEVPKTSKLELREDLKAKELSAKVEEMKEKTWYLPYLPDVTFSFGYNFKDQKWKIGIGFQVTLWDFGERRLEAESRKRSGARLEYESALEDFERGVKERLLKLEKLSRQLAFSREDLMDAQRNFEKAEKLHQLGFTSTEDFELSRLSLLEKQLEIENLENTLILEKLNYLNFLGYDIVSLLKEGDAN